MTRHTSTGCEKPWQVAKGYIHESKQYAQWEPVKVGANRFVLVATVLGLLLVAAMAFEAVRVLMPHSQPMCSEDCK